MKTLVLHPKDSSTDFLSAIYADKKDWTVINTNISKSYLKKQIKAHDRIVMLGHGTEYGLIGFGRVVIDSTMVFYLREKQCVCIWCNADLFVKEYGLKGFYTGMIISEYEEAVMYSISPIKSEDIFESNHLFAAAVKLTIDSPNMLKEIISGYRSNDNPIIMFNKDNLYQTT